MNSLDEAIDKLKEFHEKHDCTRGNVAKIPECPSSHEGRSESLLKSIATWCVQAAKRMEEEIATVADRHMVDVRLMRSHLIMEEFSELMEAMLERNEAKALDGLCDLEYVVLGTAVALDLPLSAGFDEVHRSNMTKTSIADSSHRLRSKGDEYEPPKLAEVLTDYRGGGT